MVVDRLLRVQAGTRCIVRSPREGMHGPEGPQSVMQSKGRGIKVDIWEEREGEWRPQQ